MKILDFIINKLGYIKEAQIKPNFYPENSKIPPTTKDRDLLLEPEISEDLISTEPIQGRPENLVGEPRKYSPEQEIDRYQNESVQHVTPFTQEPRQDTNVPPSNIGGFEEKSLRPFLDISDVEEYNPYIAKKMRTLGIKEVDKEMFINKYNESCKKAALKKISLSQYLEELND